MRGIPPSSKQEVSGCTQNNWFNLLLGVEPGATNRNSLGTQKQVGQPQAELKNSVCTQPVAQHWARSQIIGGYSQKQMVEK